MSVLSGGNGVIPRLKETPADAQLFERVTHFRNDCAVNLDQSEIDSLREGLHRCF